MAEEAHEPLPKSIWLYQTPKGLRSYSTVPVAGCRRYDLAPDEALTAEAPIRPGERVFARPGPAASYDAGEVVGYAVRLDLGFTVAATAENVARSIERAPRDYAYVCTICGASYVPGLLACDCPTG